MDIKEAIESRKSVRRFLDKPVDQTIIKQILNTAARAPSGHNIQPWNVYAVTGNARDSLCNDIMQAAQTEPEKHQPEYDYYPTEWHEPYINRRRKLGYELYASVGIQRDDKDAREKQMLRNYLFFDAPVGIFVTTDRRLAIGTWLDMGMFIQNILIAARGYGLHTCGQAAFTWYHDIIQKHLGYPENEILLCGIALGYEDESAPENKLVTEREPAENFTQFFGF